MTQYTYKNMPCGEVASTDCVLYVGDNLKTQEVDPTCIPSLTEVIQKIDSTIDSINKNIDIKKIKSCLTIDVEKAKVGDYLQAMVTLLCKLKADVDVLKQQQTQDLLATPIKLDLSCLGNSCDSNGATTLLTVLTTLSREVCDLKAKQSSSTDYYQQD